MRSKADETLVMVRDCFFIIIIFFLVLNSILEI